MRLSFTCTENNDDFCVRQASVTGHDGNDPYYASLGLTTCLGGQPNASWFMFQIASTGDLLIYLQQYSAFDQANCTPDHSSTPRDIDFACWGPFDDDLIYDKNDFKAKLCNNTFTLSSYDHSSHRPDNGNHSTPDAGSNPPTWGGYPHNSNSSNPYNIALTDCSFNGAATEWCYIPNAQSGDWYLLLVCNWSRQSGYFDFSTLTTPASGSDSYSGSSNCNPLIFVSTNNDMPCQGESIQLYCTMPQSEFIDFSVVPPYRYHWIAPDGTELAETVDSFYTVSASNVMSGDYKLKITKANPTINDPFIQASVGVNVQVTPAILNAEITTICKGDSVRLSTPYRLNYTPPMDGFTRWCDADENILSTDTAIVIWPTESSTYFLKVKDGNSGCNGSNSVSITVNPIPDLNISAEKTALCYGESTHITASCPAGQNVTYQWSNHNANASINVSPNETTTYTVTAKLVDGAQCEKDTSIVINVDKEIHLSSDVTPSHCEQAIGEIVMHATGGDGNFHFNAHQSTAVFIDSVASNLKPGSYVVTATDGMACTQSTTIQVPSIPGPDACFIFNSSDNVNMVVTNCTQGNNNNYYWDFGDMTTSTETHPTHEYMEPGRYTVRLEVVDNFNCLDSLSQDYVINGPVYIATAFTPNGDGINDEIMVIGKAIQEVDFLWVIYDRHGSLVFMSNSPHLSWDGTLSNGKAAMPGVYTYHLKYKDISGNHFERDGNITLIR
jgi:gliding motility-associated-like protein